MVVMVPPQYFISGSMSVLLCNEALGTSPLLAAEQATAFSQCSTIMSTRICRSCAVYKVL